MRSIEMESAKLYVKAGYFPRVIDIEAITDLQDAFGHLPYKFIIHLASDEEYRDNACNLYDLIWGREMADEYGEKGWELHEARVALEAAKKTVAALSKKVKLYEEYMK